MSNALLRKALVRLAHENPSLREHLLPLLESKQAAPKTDVDIANALLSDLKAVANRIKDRGSVTGHVHRGVTYKVQVEFHTEFNSDFEDEGDEGDDYWEAVEEMERKYLPRLQRVTKKYSKHIKKERLWDGSEGWWTFTVELR